MKKRKTKQDESNNRFRCMICQKWRLRGVWASVSKGWYQGYSVKVCQSVSCFEQATKGDFGCPTCARV